MSDRVTWLIAVKNGMPYLPETLASIAAQTYKNQEIIAWDNGSTDGTIELLNEWIPSKIFGRVVADDPQPIQISRAKLVEAATTDLCTIIDADDLADPTRLEKQVAYLAEHPEVVVVGTQMREIDSSGAIRPPRKPYVVSHDDIINLMLLENPVAQPAVLFRRSILLEIGNYRMVEAEDYDIWLRIAAKHKVVNLDEILTSYRIHEGSRTLMLQKQNRMLASIDPMIAELAPEIYGIPSDIAFKLRRRKLTFAMPVFKKIASHLDITQGRTLGTTLRTPSFLDAARGLTAPWDRLTGLMLAQIDPRPDAMQRELRSALFAVSPKIGLLKHVLPVLSRMRKNKEKNAMRQWAEETGRALPAEIDSSLIVIGRPDYADFIKMGQFGWIEKEVTFWISGDTDADPQLNIGTRTFIGQHTFIGAYKAVSIGSHTMIGAYSYLISANHRYERRDIPMGQQGFSGAPIILEEDVWLGTHVVVLPGVTIGKGAIVAAGSIVNKSIPPYQIWGGAPARFIKDRP